MTAPWFSFWLQGVLIGFSIAAPVGPIGVICIRRSLAHGRLVGFLSGLGAATADALYGLVAALGLTGISNLLAAQKTWLSLGGGAFLCYLGIRIFFDRPSTNEDMLSHQAIRQRQKRGAYTSTFLLTLTNPMTILSFTAIFAGLGVGQFAETQWDAIGLIAGVFSGSALWWLALAMLAGAFRRRLTEGNGMRWVNHLAGIVITVFGVIAIINYFLGPRPPRTIQAQVRAAAPPSAEGYLRAEFPGILHFPEDHGPHPEYQTEWWYYTGNLKEGDGRRFGYQLTFFRRSTLPPQDHLPAGSPWRSNQVYMAHFAVSDVSNRDHQAFERLSRGAVDLAGAQSAPFRVWLEDWQVFEIEPGTYHLQAAVPFGDGQPRIELDLKLKDVKGPVLQGDQGLSRKGLEPGQASYYYSLTRLISSGNLEIGDKRYNVEGSSWMDHEFSTSALTQDQVGWDWFSVQLDNQWDLMVFQIRRADGSIDPFSSGSLIGPDGSVSQFDANAFSILVENTWQSPHSGAVYPSAWQLLAPQAGIQLSIRPYLADQELTLRYAYWEGAVKVNGLFGENPVQGHGYVELTGYAGPMGGEF